MTTPTRTVLQRRSGAAIADPPPVPGNDVEMAAQLLQAARTAYTAACRLHTPTSWRSLRAGRFYRQVLQDQGLTNDVVTVCRQHVAALRQHGGNALLVARIDLALALHTDGQCDDARREVIDLQRQHTADGRRARQWIVLTRAQIAAGCGRTVHAAQTLRHNADLLADSAERDLGAIAGRLTMAERRHRLVCQRRPARSVDPGTAARLRYWRTVLHTAGLVACCPPRPNRTTPHLGQTRRGPR